MSLADDIARFLLPLKIKMQTMIGRAVLLAVDNSGKTQRVRIKMNGDELIEEIERLQEYGLETNPPIDDSSEVVINCIGGQRELSFVTKMQARALRPQGLTAGEVQLWSKFGQKVYEKKDGSLVIATKDDAIKITLTQAGDLTIEGVNLTNTLQGNKTETIAGNLVQTVTGTLTITGTSLMLTVPVIELGGPGGLGVLLESAIAKYNAHNHTDPQGGSTGVPSQLLVIGTDSSLVVKAKAVP